MTKRLKHKDMQQLNINSSSIAGIIDNLRGQLSVLESGMPCPVGAVTVKEYACNTCIVIHFDRHQG